MTEDLVRTSTSLAPQEVSVLARRPELVDRARRTVAKGRAPATDRAHRADWEIFERWCSTQGVSSLPASLDTLIGFFLDQAEELTKKGTPKTLATLRRYRASISKVHLRAGLPSPCYDDRLGEIFRGLAVEKTEQSPYAKQAATADVAGPMLDSLGTTTRDLRDRAILLLGLSSALRRSEICALDVEHLEWRPEGVALWIARSKTDRTGKGRWVGVPHAPPGVEDRCPVRALRDWLAHAGDPLTGPVFRSLWKNGSPRTTRLPPRQVAEAVKRGALRAGLDPQAFGGHSLRAGYVTQARREGLSWETIMEQTGHTKIETVKRYGRDPVNTFRTARADTVLAAFARK